MCWGARLGGSSAAVDVYVLDSMKGSEALALSLCAAEELCGGDPSAVSGQARTIADLYDLVLEDLASRYWPVTTGAPARWLGPNLVPT